MKKIKYILFLIPFLFTLSVNAQNVTSSVRCSYNGSGSTYYGDPNDGFNSARCYDTGTRYTPRLGYIKFYLPTSVMSFTAGKSYTVTMNMATNDWRNHIMLQNVRYVNSSGNVVTSSPLPSMSNFRFISRKQIKFDFKLPSGTIYPYLRFVISSPTYGNPDPDISSSSYMTGDSNWNLSSIDISPVSSSSGGSSGGSSTPTPTPSASNKDIIDNANQNTDDIMNNNNQNTTDIINNANENTNVLNDSINNLCKNTTITIGEDMSMRKGFILDGDNGGVEVQYNGGFISKYLKLKPGTSYTISRITGGSQPTSIGYCLYNANKVIYKCGLMPDQDSSITINADNYATYLRVSFVGYRVTQVSGYICNDFQNESITEVGQSVVNGAQSIVDSFNSGNQQTNDKLDDIKDNLTDETTPEINLDLNLDSSSPVSDLLTMPLTILNKVFNITDDTCQPYVLPFDFSGGNNTLTFPCIDLRDFLGNSVYNILDIILCFYLCYQIGMMCVSIYEDITSLRDGFYSLYTPKHHNTSTRVGRGEMEGKY